MNIGVNKLFQYNPIRFKAASANNCTQPNGLKQDTFTPSAEAVTRKKFDNLFPNDSINKIYDRINKDFGINNPAKLNFVYDETSKLGGGFNFKNNNIEMNLYDLLNSDKKIVGVKNGRKIPLVSPKEKLPLFINGELAEEFVNTQNKNGSLGFDKLIVEDVTVNEQRKFIIQKIAHECVHAKQHQRLRETEGINDKDIIKAWTHAKPKNMIEEKALNDVVEKLYDSSPWAKIPPAETKYTKGTPEYNNSMALMDAILNYPPVDSPLYTTNALEKEAFDISALYVKNMI